MPSGLSRTHIFMIVLVMAAPVMAVKPGQPAVSPCLHLFYQGRSKEAAVCAQAELKAHPHRPEDEILLARVAVREDRLQDAWEQLRSADREHPGNAEVAYFLARVTAQRSRQEFEAMYRINPDFWRVHELAGDAARAQGRFGEAEKEYRAAQAAAPASETVVLDALGDLAGSQHRLDEALAYYRRALRRRPDDADANFGVGAVLMARGEPAAAIAPLRRARQGRGDDAAVLLSLGQAWMETGHAARAVPLLEQAARRSGQAQAWILLGRAWHALGQMQKARQAYATADRLARVQMQRQQQAVGQMRTAQEGPQ